MRPRSRAALALLVAPLIALLALAAPSRAQSTSAATSSAAAKAPVAGTPADSLLDARTRELASQLRCPVCQGLSLQDSPSELSQQMREIVRQQLAAGKTPDEVKDYFVARYGEWILMAPTAHGFNWMVYALPFLVLAGGAWVVAVAFRRWTSPVNAPPSHDEPAVAGSSTPS